MSGDRPRFYWDTCIFLAWLKNESRKNPLEMQGIKEAVNNFDNGQTIVVTSVVTLVEVLQTSISSKASAKFKSFIQQRPNDFVMVDVNYKIAQLAHDIRDYYTRNLSPNEATITTPDAIHLATAIYMECPTFYTFDGLKEDNNKKKGMPLLPLSPQVAGQYDIEITVPPPPSQHSFL